jgi:hypothetical protein
MCNEDAGLACYEGECVCKFPGAQVWDEGAQMCRSLEGEGCTLDMMDEVPFFSCAEGLTCVSKFGRLKGICRNVKKEI